MKILKFFGNIFKWYFLGIGYICYLIFLVVKYTFFYIGSLLATIFYFLYSLLTLKFLRNAKNAKKNENLEVKQNVDKQTEELKNKNKEEAKENTYNQTIVDQNVPPTVEDLNQSNIADTNNINQNNGTNSEVSNQNDGTNNIVNNQNQTDNSQGDDIPYEEDLSVNKTNFKAEAYDPNNQGNLGYHVFMENNNIASAKNDDLLTIPNQEKKQIIKEGRTSKTARSEEKVFKEIDTKQSFREKLAVAFPTLFEGVDERKKEREEAKKNKENNDDNEAYVKLKEEENTLGPKTVYEYTARDKNGKLVKNYYEAYSLVEVQSYLLSEGYDIYKIRTNQAINILHRSANTKRKMKTSDMVFFLTQLSTYLKAGITLTESVEILSRQFKNRNYQKTFKRIANNLKSGDNFSEALAKTDGVFPKLLVNMIKTSELTGDLPETLDDMANYYSEMDKTKKQMKSALTYPTMVLILAIAVITFVLVYVIPKFTSIYASMDSATIPKLTLVIINISDFIKASYYYLITGFIIILLIIKYLYNNITAVRAMIQRMAMKIPVLKEVIIYNEVTNFTKTFSSLLKHGVYITDTMNILLQVTNNEIYRKLISNAIKHLRKGENISVAFKGHWAFPVPAYEMIVTGERTGKLAEMLAKVSEYYQDLHANIVNRMKVIIEPVLIIMLTGIVGVIILAVIVPMFGIYSSIG